MTEDNASSSWQQVVMATLFHAHQYHEDDFERGEKEQSQNEQACDDANSNDPRSNRIRARCEWEERKRSHGWFCILHLLS